MHIKKAFSSSFFQRCLVFAAAVLFLQNPLCVLAEPVDYLAEAEARKTLPIQTNEIENWPQGPEIGAESAILMDADSGTILYAKDIYRQEYPASTTKIMTCLLAMENCSMNETVTFSHDAVFSVPWDGSKIGMDEGQELTMEQALYAILVGSANEVSNAVAEHISGSSDAFSALMTRRAEELGCVNTHFTNANGLPDENHYTCAFDLATIARKFFSYELLAKMSDTFHYYIAPTDKLPNEIDVYSHNRLLPGTQYAYEYLVGSKTGYTDSSRQTLVSCAEKDGMRLICVILKEESPNQFTDTIALFDYGFHNFQKLNIAQNEMTYSINSSDFFDTATDIFGSSEPIMTLNTTDYVTIPTTVEFSDLTCDLSYDCDEENAIARLSYSYNGQPVGRTTICAASDIPGFSFDAAYDDQPAPTPVPEEKKDNVIYINVTKILAGMVIAAVLAALALYGIAYVRSYHFEQRKRDRKRRKRRRKDYRTVRRTNEQTISGLRFRSSRSSRRKRGRKPPRRFQRRF